MTLFCSQCHAEHDLDQSPDTGECALCGGPLVEHEGERVGQLGEGVVDAVTSGLTGAAIARGRVERGGN